MKNNLRNRAFNGIWRREKDGILYVMAPIRGTMNRWKIYRCYEFE